MRPQIVWVEQAFLALFGQEALVWPHSQLNHLGPTPEGKLHLVVCWQAERPGRASLARGRRRTPHHGPAVGTPSQPDQQAQLCRQPPGASWSAEHTQGTGEGPWGRSHGTHEQPTQHILQYQHLLALPGYTHTAAPGLSPPFHQPRPPQPLLCFLFPL